MTTNTYPNNPLKTLAIISPLPPQQSGISYYTQELIEHLCHHYQITTISTQEESELFIKEYQNYDRVLLHIGNSIFHTYMLNILQTVPAIIVLHDFYLNGLYFQASKLSKQFLYEQHGYQALTSNSNDYPCNQTILNQSLGVITHSQFSRELAKQFYHHPDFSNWHTIPILKPSPDQTQPLLSKQELGFNQDAIIVSSFGDIFPHKLNTQLIQAWQNSSLHKNPNAYLVFVGKLSQIPYTDQINQLIQNSPNIITTGYTDQKTYNSYLHISTLAVQLRTKSRGESSASLLDCLNHAIPTITNAHGSTKELPDDVLYMLQDHFTQTELTQALEVLSTNKLKCQTLSKKAKDYITTHHNPSLCTTKYKDSIEQIYNNKDAHKIAQIKKLHHYPLKTQVQTLLLSNLDKLHQKQILVDISSIVKHDLKTGIQRVVKQQIIHLIAQAPQNIRIEPVYLKENHFYYAREFTAQLLNLNINLKETPAYANEGDTLYSADLAYTEVNQATSINLYNHYKALGVNIVFLVHDILPITHPNFFPADVESDFKLYLQNITTAANHIITTTQTGAILLKNHLKNKTPITPIHLGSDLQTPQKTLAISNSFNPDSINFLIIGTLEPRKGHAQTLAAFEILWQQNQNITLTIVGKAGWHTEALIQTIKTHPALNKKLFYKPNTNDQELTNLYTTADALIVASQAEGFGLPLVEAAHHNLPLIIRDIPVFREIATHHAHYFPDTLSPADQAKAIKEWIPLYKTKTHPQSQNIKPLSWQDHTKELLKILI